jgi:hypothetical protein
VNGLVWILAALAAVVVGLLWRFRASRRLAAPRRRRLPEPLPLDEIFRTEDDNRFLLALFDHVCTRKEQRPLTGAERNVIHAFGLLAEVENGGFDQYFWNSTGDDARHIVGALDAIGARRIADITRRAVALFGDEGPSGDRRKRWKQMDRDRDYKELVWNELDVEFYECEEPLEQALVAYARSHAAEFAE